MCLQKQNYEQLLIYTFIIDASHIFLVKTHCITTFNSITARHWVATEVKKEWRLFVTFLSFALQSPTHRRVWVHCCNISFTSIFAKCLICILLHVNTIHYRVNIGPSTFITLNWLQTYLIRSTTDLTGRRITSNKPLALFSNHECTNVDGPILTSVLCSHVTIYTS